MAKGDIAKSEVLSKIKSALGEAYIGEENKKYYFWSSENGEKVQVAISLTCPKTPIAPEAMPSADKDFSIAPQTAPVVEVSDEEKANLQALMERLGL